MILTKDKFTYKHYIPFLGLPLRGKLNPLLILKTDYELVCEVLILDVPRGEVRVADQTGSLGRGLVEVLKVFTYKLSNALGFNYCVEVRVLKNQLSGLDAYLFTALTSAITKSIIGERSLSNDLIKSLRVIDFDIFSIYPGLLIHTLRYSEIMNSTYIFRLGEEPIKIEGFPKVGGLKVIKSETIRITNTEVLDDLITRLIGLIPIEAVRNAGKSRVLRRLVKLENVFWWWIYDLEPLNTQGKWVWDLDKAKYVRFEWLE
ncbi:MAG: hypothetical protein DRO18_03795 [Thermoprotei archaeon]|nr:MAG: hypothetical protein DRO18_03795 [Thermoprotei archaeon]